MSFTGLLRDSFTPYTLAVADDGMGGQTSTWSAGTAFQGRLSILKADERLGPDKTTVIATHKLYCNSDVTLIEQSRVTCSTRTFEVRAVQLPSNLSGGIGHLEVTLMEID